MSLQESLDRYRSEAIKVIQYVNLAYEVDSSGDYIRTSDEIDFIVSSAFLRSFISWEEFLETAFIDYLVGEPSATGDVLVRYANPIDKIHANKLIIGTQKYVDWANSEIIKRLSAIFFQDGEPFSTALSSINTELSDLKTIRNASAHISTTTRHKLDAVASRILGRTVSNISVTDLIMHVSPEDPSKTVFQMFLLKLDIAAENVSQNRT